MRTACFLWCLVWPAGVVAAQAQRAPAGPLHASLDEAGNAWHSAQPIADGVRGGAARFDGARAHIDLGPCPVDSAQPFTLRCSIRTTAAGFCTPLMARDGEAVGLSLVVGRSPGRISFEAWSWQSVRIGSQVRIDDGRWHTVEVPYDPATNTAAMFVDDVLQGFAELGPGSSPTAQLRLGDNIGAHQPFPGDLDEVEVLRTTARRDRLAALAPVLPLERRKAALRQLRAELLPKRSPSLDAAAAAAWPARRLAVRAHVADALGLLPPPPDVPLDVQVHKEIARDGVRLQRISWIGFKGQRATGWLWLPEPMPQGRLPAILNPHGHWQNGARHPVVQARCASFAKFGWIALAIDSVHVEDVGSGINSVGAMTWHNQRAIGLLTARPDVDPARIASTGASGGGQQTYYLMALEDRLAAAAPMVMACYLAEIVDDTTAHCGCNHTPRLAAGTDVPEMCAVFAPRPVMFGSVTGDWTHAFPEQGLPELRAHWARLHGPEPRARHADEGHNYDRPMREEVYAFLHDALLGMPENGRPRRRVAEPSFAVFTPAELQPLLQARPNAELDAGALAAESLARRAAGRTLAEVAPGLSLTAAPRPIVWTGPDDAEWRAGVVAAEVGIPMRLRGADQGDAVPFTVVVDPRGIATLLAERPPWLAALQRPVVADPRPYGEWGPFRSAWQRNGIFLGRGEGYQAAVDIAAVCASLPGTTAVHLVGLGEAGVASLLAAHLCPRITRLVTDDLGRSYADDRGRLPLCPELLRVGDLPELIRTLPSACAYELGGAAPEPAGSPGRSLCPPFSAAELAARLSPRTR